mgnify:CR=1 FL=1
MPSSSYGRAEPIDYVSLAAALLDRAQSLVPQWLPGGVERNGRWYVGDFDGTEGESANVNLRTGQWIDNGGTEDDRGGDLISLYARIRGLNNSQAARELMQDLGWNRPVVQPPRQRQAEAAPWDGGEPAAAQAPEPDDAPPEPDRTPAAPARAERWRSVLPVPRHAPEPKRFRFGFKNKATGQWEDHDATRTWAYEFEGQRYGYVARFDRINSKGVPVKDVMPLTWCEDTQDPRGSQRWHWKQWAAPRPLYVPATLLSGTPDKVPVVLVEGEKCAQAGLQLLGHEFDFVSWPGGGKAWPLAHWGWLMGRTVYLWPDADAQHVGLTKLEREQGVDPLSKPLKPLAKQPGFSTMAGIGSLLIREQGCTVFMLPMKEPGERPDGWDLADAVADGWGPERVRDYIRSALPFRPPEPAVAAAAGIFTPSMTAVRGEGVATGDADAPSPNAWLAYLMTSGTGSVQKVRENVVLALDGRPDKGVPGIEECAGLIRFNAFTNNVEKVRPAPWGSPAGDWLEADELLLGDWLVRVHGMPSMARETLVEAVLVVAHRHAYHPVRDRMVARRDTWDGVPRLDGWLERVCMEEDEHPQDLQDYLRMAGRFFLMAMCARVMPEVRRGIEVVVGPGAKFDYMLVLEGPQGYGKSTLAAILGGPYYADTGLDVQHKDSLMNIQGVLVYEWSELESLTKQEVGDVKRFISSPTDRFRATFDKRPAKYPRQVVFVGTTNEAHYLIDTTGNRRFWPVRLQRPPDLEWLRANLEQLLAEAVHAVDAGERFYPSRDEEARLFKPQQQARSVESSLEGAIRAYLYDERQKVPMGQANGSLVNEIGLQQLLGCIGYTIDKQTDAVVKKAGGLMHMLGWTVRRLSPDEEGKRPRVYVRPKDAPRRPTAAPGAATSTTGPDAGPPTDEDPDAPPF